MYENGTAVSWPDGKQHFDLSEFDPVDLFTQIFAVLTATQGVLGLLKESQKFFDLLVKLSVGFFPSKQPFLTPVSRIEDLTTLMVHGDISGLLDDEKTVQIIIDVIVSQNIFGYRFLIPAEIKLEPLKNLLKEAKPDNIRLLMEKISSRLFDNRRISVGDFLQILDSLSDARAQGFVEGIAAAGSGGLLLENGAVMSASEGFNQFFRCLNPIKQELALRILTKHMPEMMNDIGGYLSVFKILGGDQRARVLPKTVVSSVGNTEKRKISSGFPHEWQAILDNPSLENLATLLFSLNDLGIMCEMLMYIIKDRLLKASDLPCASSKIERFTHTLSFTKPDFFSFFLMDPDIFLKAITNKKDIMRVFSNLRRQDKLDLFFLINTHLQNVIIKSGDVEATLNQLKPYLPTELIAFLQIKLEPFMMSKIPADNTIISSIPTVEDFFKYCFLFEYCFTILNQLIWEKRNPHFPSFSTELELKAALKTRLTYPFSPEQTKEIVEIMYPKGIYGFYEGPFPDVVHSLNPLQLFNFFKVIGPILYDLNQFSDIDADMILWRRGRPNPLDESQQQAFLASLKPIAKQLMENCAERGIRFGGCGVYSGCDPTHWMTKFSIAPTMQKYYLETFVAPYTRLIFDSMLRESFSDDEDPESTAFGYRLSIFFGLTNYEHKGVYREYFIAGLLNSFESTLLGFTDGVPKDYGDALYKIQSALFKLLKDIIVNEANTISKLETLTDYISVEQFQIVCEEIRDKFPNRFRLEDFQSFLSNYSLTHYPSTFKREYERVARNTLGKYDYHNEEELDINGSLGEDMPETDAFFNALNKHDVNGVKKAYEGLSSSLGRNSTFCGFFKRKLRELTPPEQAIVEAGRIDPHRLDFCPGR